LEIIIDLPFGFPINNIISLVCSNKEARKRPTESNGTPAMDVGLGTDHVRIVVYACSRHVTGYRQEGTREGPETCTGTSQFKGRQVVRPKGV